MNLADPKYVPFTLLDERAAFAALASAEGSEYEWIRADILRRHLRLVKRIALNVAGPFGLDEMMSEGACIVAEKITKYKVRPGVRFGQFIAPILKERLQILATSQVLIPSKRFAKSIHISTTSIDAPIYEDGNTLHEMIPHQDDRDFDRAIAVEQILKRLDGKDRNVLVRALSGLPTNRRDFNRAYRAARQLYRRDENG